MSRSRICLGAAGEDATLELYRLRGYSLVARNWRCRIGEIDLVMTRGDTLVFCEVKSRGGSQFGPGHAAVTPRKQSKVRSVAQAFLIANRTSPPDTRFDVASVSCGPGGAVSSVEVFEDAF